MFLQVSAVLGLVSCPQPCCAVRSAGDRAIYAGEWSGTRHLHSIFTRLFGPIHEIIIGHLEKYDLHQQQA